MGTDILSRNRISSSQLYAQACRLSKRFRDETILGPTPYHSDTFIFSKGWWLIIQPVVCLSMEKQNRPPPGARADLTANKLSHTGQYRS